MQRLLRTRDFSATINLLLDYDLDDAVNIATEVLRGLDNYEREFCLFRIFQGLSSISQSGLAMQILVESGIRTSQRQRAFKELSALQGRLVTCPSSSLRQMETLCTGIARRMRGSSRKLLDTHSASLLMRRALDLDEIDYAQELVLRCWHAGDASKIFFERQKEGDIMQLFMKQLEHARASTESLDNPSIWKYVIRRQSEPEDLKLLSQLCPDDPDLRFNLATQAARSFDTLQLCFSNLHNLPPLQVSFVLFRLLKNSVKLSQSELRQTNDSITTLFSDMENSARSEVLERFLQLVKQSTAGNYTAYPMQNLMVILGSLDRVDHQIPAHIMDKLGKHILHRPSHQLLQFLELSRPDHKFIRGIVNHHLRVLRIVDTNASQSTEKLSHQSHDLPHDTTAMEQDDEEACRPGNLPAYIANHERIDPKVFAEIIITLHTRSRSEEDLAEICKFQALIMHSLSQLHDTSILLSYLERTKRADILPTPILAANMIRSLAQRPHNISTITYLLATFPTHIMTYDVFARYISRISFAMPASAMQLLRLLVKRKLTPKRRLLQNVMLGISESTAISEGRSFKYLAMVLALSKSLAISIDRVFLASLLRVVLIRQGLGAATRRLGWLLSMSSKLSSNSTYTYGKHISISHQELLEVLRKWHIYERSRGVEERTGIVGPRRPKRLRELVESLASRRTVIGRKRTVENLSRTAKTVVDNSDKL